MPQARRSLKLYAIVFDNLIKSLKKLIFFLLRMQRIQSVVKYLLIAIFVKLILVRKYTLVQIFQLIYNFALRLANRIVSTKV